MDWRKTLLENFGPGILGGIGLRDWLRILRQQRFAVSPTCLPRALSISAQATRNSIAGWREAARYRERIERAVVEPPLFILGHWRSGTTHLHTLLALDERFAFPNNYQVSFPRIFLGSEERDARLASLVLTPRRPMDNVEWTMASAQEDEFAIASLCGLTPCLGWVFPRCPERFERFLRMRDASPDERAVWRAALELFVRKLTVRYGRPVILKSPPHTARVRLLLEIFPEAKFVHIHRHPYDVYPSTRRTFEIVTRWHRLQTSRQGPEADRRLEAWLLRQYRVMHEAYFEERSLIPPGRLVEVGFAELERGPLGVLRSIYEALSLPEFAHVQSRVEEYLASIANYERNSFPPLPKDLRSRIATEWSVSFDAWGYER